MPPLHQLRIKLLNTLETGDARQVNAVVDEVFDSMGGCEKCYGRGYTFIGQESAYCDCKRADQLKGFVEGQSA